MANQNQVKGVKQGAAAWNTWRKQHPHVKLDLNRANLIRSKLSGADLSNADLNCANLMGANLMGANLSGADLSVAHLNGASLMDANLSGADLSNAHLNGASLWRTTLANLDLRSVQGLIEICHRGPSVVSLHSIQLPHDGSALHFLRGAGIPEEWIGFYRATMMQPIQYQSVFISYSSDDESISKRLHADLQANGVRCWFAPHDLKPGDYFREKIDEAIHLQDKLLLILSEKSVTSKWVKYEVNRALDREVNQERTILFPIRLDETVLHTKDQWAADIRSRRHIGNFTNWEDHTTYQRSFDQLLKQLKADTR
jgi:TIR domain/Pentapeptide repeats (8 copies)